MAELKDWLNLIATAIGSTVSFSGVLIALWWTTRNQRSKESREHLRSKCERVYHLGQLLYNGHLDEIHKLERSKNTTFKQWSAERKHPGDFMSETKMLVKMYLQSAQTELDVVDKSHQALKESFIKLDNDFAIQKTVWDERRDQVKQLYVELENLGNAITNLKNKVADVAKNT